MDREVDITLLMKISWYINENYRQKQSIQEYDRYSGLPGFECPEFLVRVPQEHTISELADKIEKEKIEPEESFVELLMKTIDKIGMSDVETYTTAGIDRKLFSKIRSDYSYTPSKKNVIRLILALELDIDEAEELLKRAGYALSSSKEVDLLVKWCIINKVYNIITVNEIITIFGYKTL